MIAAKGYSRWRWVLLGLLFFSTVLNYLDRQALSILAPMIQSDLKMDDLAYAGVVQLFLIAYTIAYLGAGWLTDRLGSRLSLALFVSWWSLANIMTGFVTSVAQLGMARFALGLGEAGNYTAAPKTVAERFPPQQRALGVAVYTSGAMIGATIAPPLIGWLALTYGWRQAFVATGALGCAWLVGWIIANRFAGPPPEQSTAQVERSEDWSWGQIVTNRPMWLLALARGVTDPVWYFYLFWFPKYLSGAQDMSLAAVASVAWIVYLAADVGALGGGWLSGRLMLRGLTAPKARIVVMAIAATLAPLGAFVALQLPLAFVLALGALVALAHMAFLINLTALVVDVFPNKRLATIFGIIAAGSGVGGIASTWVVGQFAQTGAYESLFVGMALLHPLGWLLARLASKIGTRVPQPQI
ncbi:MFS transporter [Sphingomonas sp. 37zxx]|uniref:MFS transporter n=1 Tax=Sphingomonas sp. 37zxx TaxID=1550073 RepID=UPI00053C0781|nr:MFS transporter [Sphingomonas sp. 37zxx]